MKANVEKTGKNLASPNSVFLPSHNPPSFLHHFFLFFLLSLQARHFIFIFFNISFPTQDTLLSASWQGTVLMLFHRSDGFAPQKDSA